MRMYHLRFLCLAVVCVSASADTRIDDVGVEEFRELVDRNDGIILDVRTPDEVAEGHIPGASILNINDDDFLRKLNLMQKDKPIYVYCRSGGRSARAAKMMGENGFETVYNLLGGIGAWKGAGMPLAIPEGPSKKAVPGLSIGDFNQALGQSDIVLADFHTEWCAPCKQMAPVVDALASELSGKARVLKIDVDASAELAEAFDIEGVPVFILFQQGKEIWRHSGVVAKETLAEKIEGAARL